MLAIQFIRKNVDLVRKAIVDKGSPLDLDALLAVDQEVLALGKRSQALQEERNRLAKSFGKLPADEKAAAQERSRAVREEIDAIGVALKEAEARLAELMWLTPNIPGPNVPVGPDSDANPIVKVVGTPRVFDFPIRDHVEIMGINGWAEFDRVTEVCGSRTFALTGDMVRVEMAIHMMVMDLLVEHGFTPITVPSMAREGALFGTGHFPFGREDVYHLAKDDLYLAGTAEVILTSLHKGELLDEAKLPILYAGYSPCFRREAGSAGRDVRGLLRVHQFTKVEQYVICRNDPEESARWHQILLGISEQVLQKLELPYQVVECCTGDMGFGKVNMNDVETWVPSLGKYRETHSCSSLHEWQARRANLRYRGSDGKVQFVHTLNNTAVATPRILVNLVENHQTADARLAVPAALQPYLGGRTVLGKGV
jgi:seryl-tRNA synthetase